MSVPYIIMTCLHITLFVKLVCSFEPLVLAGSFEERLLKLERTVTKQQGTIEMLENHVNELKSENCELKETLLENRIEYEEKLIKNLDGGVENHKESVDGIHPFIESKNERGGDKIDSPKRNVQRSVNSFETTVHRIKSVSKRKNTQAKTGDSPNVAFHAMMSASRCFQVHEPYVFDYVEVDIGNGYNSDDGIYTVPSAGTYVFAFSIVSYHSSWLRAELVVNGLVKVDAVSDAESAEDYHPSFEMIVVNVNAGDHVFVRGGGFSNCGVISDGSHGRSTLSGWKLF